MCQRAVTLKNLFNHDQNTICTSLLADEYFYEVLFAFSHYLLRNSVNKQEGRDGPGSLTRVIFPTNELYIFVPLLQTCDSRVGASFDPKGHHMNKIDKGLQGDATYQKSKLYPFQFQRRRILKLVFFVPIFQIVTPCGGFSFDPKGIIRIKLIKVHKEMLNIKALILPVSEKKKFEIGFLCSYVSTYDPWGGATRSTRRC